MRPQRGGRELSPAALQAQFLAVFAAGRCREQVSQNLANHAHALRLDDTEAADEYEKMEAWAVARSLDLAFCGLVNLPARIVDTRTAHLYKLDVERNQLEEIEAVVGLTALRELRAGHNRIRRIPPTLPRALKQLRTLALADNRITEVPSDISSLAKLTCVCRCRRYYHIRAAASRGVASARCGGGSPFTFFPAVPRLRPPPPPPPCAQLPQLAREPPRRGTAAHRLGRHEEAQDAIHRREQPATAGPHEHSHGAAGVLAPGPAALFKL